MRCLTNQPQFDRTRLELLPLAERIHDLDLSSIREVKAVPREKIPEDLFRVAQRIVLRPTAGPRHYLPAGWSCAARRGATLSH